MRVALRLGFFALLGTMAGAETAPPMRVLLRVRDDAMTVKVGEPITVEYACMVEPGGEVDSSCTARVEVKAISGGARLSLDPAQHVLLDEALKASFPIGVCGTTVGPGKLAYTAEPEWKSMEVTTHFPVEAGLYEIHASVSDESGATYEAQPVELEVVGDPGWHNSLLQTKGCMTDTALGVLPDEPRAMAAMRAHLAECAKENDFALRDAIEQIVWLELQTKAPGILSKMQQRDTTYTPNKPVEIEVRRWMRAQYRSLLLETARQLVGQHRRDPKNDDSEIEVEMGFAYWGEMMRNFTEFDHPLLTRAEVTSFLKAAGYSGEDVKEFFQ